MHATARTRFATDAHRARDHVCAPTEQQQPPVRDDERYQVASETASNQDVADCYAEVLPGDLANAEYPERPIRDSLKALWKQSGHIAIIFAIVLMAMLLGVYLLKLQQS